MPSTFENVLTQQLEGSQQSSSQQIEEDGDIDLER